MFDNAKQDALNRKHAEHPEPGDFWDEMFVPIARVLMVSDSLVCFQRLNGCREMTETSPKPHVMSRRAFNKWLRYDTIRDKTWADVSPRRFPPADKAEADRTVTEEEAYIK